LSTSLEIPLSELRDWLKSQTSSVLTPIQSKAEKLMGDMRKAHESLTEACRMLLDSSRKEIEKRNMRTFKRAQALNKLAKLFLERMQQVRAPEKPSFKDFEDFVKVAQKAYAVTDVDVRNWFPRISPFFIIDRGKFLRTFENAKGSLKELSEFLAKEYVKAKSLEETFQLIEEIKALEEQLATIKGEKEKALGEKAKLEEELAYAQRRMAELARGGDLAELAKIDEVIDGLRKEVAHSLRHLQKAFAKLQSLALHGEGSGLTPEELKKLNEYLTDPFEALATEDLGTPLLKQILQKTLKHMSEGKLKLKQEKERKARQAIEEILDKNSLASLHQKCAEAKLRKVQLSASSAVAETRTEISKQQEHADRLKKKLESVESEIGAIEKSLKETAEKIGNCKIRIEKNILDFSGQKVKITI